MVTPPDPTIRASHLLRALAGTDICVFYQNRDLIYDWIENPPTGWSRDAIVGSRDDDILPADVASVTSGVKRNVLSTGESQRTEIELQSEMGLRAFDIYVEPDLSEDGQIQGVLCFAIDTTAKRRREHNMRELLLEVSHRSRNMLAIVQSLANHSLRSPDNGPMLTRFNERLQSLASTLSVVTQSEWDGAYLHELARMQIKPYLESDTVLDIHGEDVELTPNAAIHVGLALQELAANSALDKRAPIVGSDIGFAIEREEKAVILRWHERTNYAAEGDELDAVTLRQIVPHSLNGKADLKHEDGLLTYTLRIPTENLR